MDTLENKDMLPEREPNAHQEPAAPAERVLPVQEPAAAEMPVREPAPQPQYDQPPYSGYYAHQYRQPAYYAPQYAQPGYQPPRVNQPVYAEPGTPQNAYVPPRPRVEPAAPVAPVKKKRNGRVWKKIVAVVLILALVGGSCWATAYCVNGYWEDETAAMRADFNRQIDALRAQINADQNSSGGAPVSGGYVPTGKVLTPAQVYANNVQSVVAVTCTVSGSFYGQTTTGTSTGSGFIITEDGYIVTNYHVVEGATSVTVTTNSGTNYTAAVVGGDSSNDIAVLKVEGSGLPAVAIGSSSSLIVGDQVAAIGNPLGELTNTLTVGYVSAKDRMVTTEGFGINMLQTDAAINSGNSGGPLFNMYGEVVGITSAKYSGESSSGASIEGIGFAIPIDDVIGMIEDLITQGYIGGAYLGVKVSDMNAEAADYYGLPVGAYVQEVTLGSAAQNAGIQVKDIIVALGEHEINGVTSLTRALRNFSAGETTTVTVYRNGAKQVLTITLDAKPQS